MRAFLITLGLLIASSAFSQGKPVTQERILEDSGKGEHWLLNGGNFRGEHFSVQSQVNEKSVEKLGLDWWLDLPMPNGISATPLVVDGVIYLSGPFSIVYAINAENGRVQWTYDPKVVIRDANDWTARVNRGVALWGDRVLVTVSDCRLIALDRKSGEEAWSKQTCDPEKGYSITDAPRVGGGKVFVGNAGSESGFRNRGFVSAYDAESGEFAWRFFTVPSDKPEENTTPAMKMAAKTWSGQEWQKYGGGGNAWNEMTYDPDSGLLYFGTSGAMPYIHRIRSPEGGDNLFTSSVVAVDAQSGELLAAEHYVRVNLASHIDLETGRPVLDEEGMYWKAPPGSSVLLWPNMWGAHSTQPMAWNPDHRLAYIPAIDVPQVITYLGEDETRDTLEVFDEIDGKPHVPGKLIGWDPVAQKERWSVNHDVAYSGGVLTTGGGLVFQGDAKGYFSAYHAESGRRHCQPSSRNPLQRRPSSRGASSIRTNGVPGVTARTRPRGPAEPFRTFDLQAGKPGFSGMPS